MLDVLGDVGLTMHWDLVLRFSGIGVLGSVVGGEIGTYVPSEMLKRGFALFLVLLGRFILWENANVML